MSDAVARACDGKLQLRPLASQEVQQWRAEALGPQAPWAPTLIRVDERVSAWVGTRMALVLARHLGPRSTLKALRALGELRERAQAYAGPPEEPSRPGMRRAQFLRVAAGSVIAGGLVLAGKAPAFAATEVSAAQSWVNAHAGALPSSYEEFANFSLPYRRAIFGSLSPAVRSRLWSEQLNRYLVAHPDLPANQRAALRSAITMAADESVFDPERSDWSATHHARLSAVTDAAIQAFGSDEAHGLIANLGTSAAAVKPDAGPPCDCSLVSNWCASRCIGAPYCVCGISSGGCGTFWAYDCNGQCTPIANCG
jgi:hypothetical protein